MDLALHLFGFPGPWFQQVPATNKSRNKITQPQQDKRGIRQLLSEDISDPGVLLFT